MKTDPNQDFNKDNHLSDEQLYDLAYKECNWILFTDEEADARNHVALCETCRKSFDAYLGLMSITSFDFMDSFLHAERDKSESEEKYFPASDEVFSNEILSEETLLGMHLLLAAEYALHAQDIQNMVKLQSAASAFMNFALVPPSKKGMYRSGSKQETITLETEDSVYSSISYNPNDESLSIELDVDLFNGDVNRHLIARIHFKDGSTREQDISFEELSEAYSTTFFDISPEFEFKLMIMEANEDET